MIASVLGTTTALLGASSVTVLAADGAMGETQAWAVIVALAGTVGLLLRWMMKRQDDILQAQQQRDEHVRTETTAREDRREAREEARAEQVQLQTRAMQDCVTELRQLSAAQASCRVAIDDIPDRVLQRLEPRKTP